MSETETSTEEEPRVEPKWKPIPAIERRVLGVLGEKGRTTPDAYPLSLNALISGCNQKSNRFPQMNLEPIQVEDALEKLRAMGAVSEVQGSGRVPRFRHYMYEWLAVDKLESAVMIELLLRGAQTVGELRGRAARMAKEITDLSALRPVLKRLIERGLVLALSAEGRGQIVTHALYLDNELEKVKRKAVDSASAAPPPAQTSNAPRTPQTVVTPDNNSADLDEVAELRGEVGELREMVTKLKSEIDDIWASLK